MRTRRCIKRIEKREDAVSSTTTTKVSTGNRPTTKVQRVFGRLRGGGGVNESLEGVVVLQQRRKHQAAYGSKSKSGRRDNKMPYQRNERAIESNRQRL